MKHKLLIFIAVICLFGFVLAESDAFLDYFTARDWFSMESARNAAVPEGLTEREEAIYRAGFASGHYDALNPEYIEGLFVLNTKTGKFHLSNCMQTLLINTGNRQHSTLSARELTEQGYKPCGACNPDRKDK